MNKVFLIGNLTKDPELKEIGSKGTKVCKFGLAVNRKENGENVADFYNINVFNGLAENCAEYLKKGSKIAVAGDITLRRYLAKDGSNQISVDVKADMVEFLSTKTAEHTSSYDKRNDIEMKPIADTDFPF